ncbi:MAG: phosphate-starvation-inducible PsiE family protein [Campylobacterales bacterium]
MQAEIEHILEDYRLSKSDLSNIAELSEKLYDDKSRFLNSLYDYMVGFDELEKLGKEQKEFLAQNIKHWYSRLLSGDYDTIFYKELYRVGSVMAKNNLTPHHINIFATFIRDYLYRNIGSLYSTKEDRDRVRSSAFKVVDICVDTISLAFRQEELSFFLSNSRLHKGVINFAGGFSLLLDMFLTLFLVLLAILIGAYTAYEILSLFIGTYDVSKKALSILGNMLILWAIVELLEENIKHLKGAKFAIKVFVSVGLAAIVREILIASLAHNYSGLGFMTATLLALGIVYYLLDRGSRSKS